ncbi:MAG: T9SS type A sorting domain-containing protein [Saprospiraceae bacterium]|nr:T9SS type A sorting domain-containing protein [Candidatus Brachybacter algidus]
MPIINDLSGDKFINDDLIYDECGPFLLAKEKEGVCYTWYEINKQSKKPTLLTGKEDSWLKLNSSIDVENNTYIAIIHDCSDICDSTVIFTRSDESGKTIPCYNSGESAIKIYPNPNQGHMYLKLEGLPAGKQEVFIYDMMGRQVYKKTIDHTGNNDITELSLTHLPDGIYLQRHTTMAQASPLNSSSHTNHLT